MTQKKKILFYSPHAGIAFTSAVEGKLAGYLQENGYDIFYVSCHRALKPYCVTMSAHSVLQDSPESEKNKICYKCEKSANYMAKRYNLKDLNLQNYLTNEDLKKIKAIVDSTTQENYLDLKHLGIQVGKKALYECLLQYKKSELNFNETEWCHYKMALESSLKSLIAGAKILDQVKPDLVICYNTQYSAHGVIEEYAKKQSIPVYFIHAGLNLYRRIENLMVAIAPPVQYYKRIADTWPQFRNIPLKAQEVSGVLGHIRELLDASSVFVYSTSTTSSERPDIRKLYGISKDQKVLVAALSSYDERFAAESNMTLDAPKNSIFKSQIEWVQFLVDHVKTRPDLFLLIRVHPREFPNKRERMKSQHADQLKKIFDKLPENAKVNWPSDNLSLYHLAEETSVFLNAWSSVGKEMGALGRPVVLYSSDLPFYAADINYTAKTKEEYIAMIEEGLKIPFLAKRITDAFRLFNLEFSRATLDISPMFNQDDLYPKIKFLRKVEGKLLKYTSSIRMLKRLLEKPAALKQKEDLEKLFDNPDKDLIHFRTSTEQPNEREERKALLAALEEVFNTLYPKSIQPSNPSTSLYTHMKKFLEESKSELQ